MDPNNNPKWENWFLVLFGLLGSYYLATYEKPAKEITYMECVNDYITKNNVKQVIIKKDKRSDAFSFKAEIIPMDDSPKVYLTLGSVDNFLAKLDMV